jgi:glutamyl-tRNA(Gln) amidotransferase subunit D
MVNDTVKLLGPYRKKEEGKTQADTELNTKVSLLYSRPGLTSADVETIGKDMAGMVIAGTGLGHVPRACGPALKEMIEDGKTVVMTTQCLWGRVNMNVYSTGRDLMKAGVIPGEDMLPEMAWIKLMWVLAHAETDEISSMMQTNLAGEITRRTKNDTF